MLRRKKNKFEAKYDGKKSSIRMTRVRRVSGGETISNTP